MGDLRMLFAEDKNKVSFRKLFHQFFSHFFFIIIFGCLPQVKKIVDGQFELFKNMYKPLVEEYESKQLLRLSSSADRQLNISQVCLDS